MPLWGVTQLFAIFGLWKKKEYRVSRTFTDYQLCKGHLANRSHSVGARALSPMGWSPFSLSLSKKRDRMSSSDDDDEPLSQRLANANPATVTPLEDRIKALEDGLARENRQLRAFAVWSTIDGWREDTVMTVNAIAQRLEPVIGTLDRPWLREAVKTYAEEVVVPPAATKPAAKKKKKK